MTHPRRVAIARAPVRIDFAGGFTDVPPYCLERTGAVVNAAIDRFVAVEVRRTRVPGYRVRVGRATLRVASRNSLDPRGPERLVQAVLLATGAPEGLAIRVRSDAPAASGLGTSGATGVALLAALDALEGRRRSASALAREARRIEVEICGHPGGGQDQAAAAHGGFLFLEFSGPDPRVRPIAIPAPTRAALRRRLVLVDTGRSRVSGRLIESVTRSLRRGSARTRAALDALVECADAARDALSRGDLDALARAVARNWDAEKRLHPSVTNARLDRLFETARRAGAIGGKALGAGGGGCLFFVAAEGAATRIRRALADAGARCLSFDFERRGVRVHRTAPSAGA